VLLEKDGEVVNHKRLLRVYQEAGLAVRRRERKRLARDRCGMPVLSRPNQEWSIDFVSDALAKPHRDGASSDSCSEPGKSWIGIVVGVIDAKGRRIIAYGSLAKDNKRPERGNTLFVLHLSCYSSRLTSEREIVTLYDTGECKRLRLGTKSCT
jgi:hypothetical protein